MHYSIGRFLARGRQKKKKKNNNNNKVIPSTRSASDKTKIVPSGFSYSKFSICETAKIKVKT